MIVKILQICKRVCLLNLHRTNIPSHIQSEDPLCVEQNISLHPELGHGEQIISQQALCALKVFSIPSADQRVEVEYLPGALTYTGQTVNIGHREESFYSHVYAY